MPENGKASKQESRENERRNEAPRISSPLPSAREIEEQLFAGSTIMTVPDSRRQVQRPLRTLRMYPTGRHSPAELLRVMLGQLWTLPVRARRRICQL